MMKYPNMILFDYGQTLVDEAPFDGGKGTEAVLRYAVENKYQKSAMEIQAAADQMNQEMGRFDPERRHLFQIEVPNAMFTSYLYESQGIRLSIGSEEIDRVFWEAASPGTATEGIKSFLEFLKQKNIRTGVISNISYCSKVVKERIKRCVPNHTFEFILTSSEYLYRKPNKRIFELALEKADLKPEEVWYIGDQYRCDVTGAAGAGLFPVWYLGASAETGQIEQTNQPEKEAKGNAKVKEDTGAGEVLAVKSWKELQAILEALEG